MSERTNDGQHTSTKGKIDFGAIREVMNFTPGPDSSLGDWWVDRELWEDQVRIVEADGGDLVDLALGYCEAFLSKNSERYTLRFGLKYGSSFNPEIEAGYQPNGAWGGGYVDSQYLLAVKGIEGPNDLLPLSDAIRVGYGSSPEINEMIEAKDLDQCREILSRINPRKGINFVEEVDPGNPDVLGWMGVEDIEIREDASFDKVHPIVVHEGSHVDSGVRTGSVFISPEATLEEFLDITHQLRMISSEDVARINEIRAYLRWFAETGDGYYLGWMIDAAKFYDWHCFGRVGNVRKSN